MRINEIIKPSDRSLVRELVISDFKLRYQNSVLGYVWSLLRPLMLFGVLYVVFTVIIKIGKGVPYYPSYLLLGLVTWTFFIEATMSGLNAITGRGDLVRKVSIPKYLIVVSTTLSAFVNFTLNMGGTTTFAATSAGIIVRKNGVSLGIPYSSRSQWTGVVESWNFSTIIEVTSVLDEYTIEVVNGSGVQMLVVGRLTYNYIK